MLKANKLIFKNTAAQYLKVIISTVISLFTTRIVLRQLGVADYGVFSVIAGFVTLFGVMNNSMIVAVQRFVSYEIPTKDNNKISSIYTTSLYIHVGMAILVLLLCETVGLYFLKNHMQFPVGKLDDAVFVYHCVIVTLIFNILSIPQQALLVSYEKIFISSIIGIIDTLLKLAGAVILIYISNDKLRAYAFIYAVVAISVRLLYSICVKKYISDIRFTKIFKPGILKELLSFAGWNLLGAVANVFKIQGVNVVLNMFYGTVINTAYGLANQISGNLTVLSSSIFQASNSQVIQAYRNEDLERLNFLVFKMTKFAFALFYLVSLPIVCLSDKLFFLWLGEVPEGSTVFLSLMVVNAVIELFSIPLMYIMQATGNIRKYFIVVSLTMLMIVPISYVLLKIGSPYYIVLIVTIAINILLLCIRTIFVSKVSVFKVRHFIKEIVLPSFIIVIITLAVMYVLMNVLSLNQWWLTGSCSLLFVVISVWLLLLTRAEKEIIISAVKNATKIFIK